MNQYFRRSARAIALVVAIGLAGASAQEPAPDTVHRLLVKDSVPWAIDRGIRDNDPPTPPRTFADARIDRSRANGDYLPGSLILKIRGRETFDVVSIAPGADPERLAAEWSTHPDVEYAQARYRVHPAFVPNDPLYSRQWNLSAIDMEHAWDINPGASSSVIVAVLDTGLAYRNVTATFNGRADTFDGLFYPALGPVQVPFAAAPEIGAESRIVAPVDLIWQDTVPLDLDGHGTHVAGTIGQLTNNGVGTAGIAFNVRLMPVKVIDGPWDMFFRSPREGTDDIVARGVRHAVDNGARVLNMSIGRGGGPAPAVREAIQYAVSRGAFVVAAAGNEFGSANTDSRLAEFADDIDGMVAVSAISRDGTRAYYSNVGPYVELTAPGGDQRRNGNAGGILQQTYDLDLVETYLLPPSRFRAPRFDAFTYEFFQGTSMAVPHVSGFAALLIQQGITNPAAIEAAMKRYAIDLGAPGRDNAFGFGLINPRATLRGLGLLR